MNSRSLTSLLASTFLTCSLPAWAGQAPFDASAPDIPLCRGGRPGFGHNRRHDVMGLRRLVASARGTENSVVFATRHAVQSRLLGLHLPTRGLFSGYLG